MHGIARRHFGREGSSRMAFLYPSRLPEALMTELKHTPLNATHRALKARMVDLDRKSVV